MTKTVTPDARYYFVVDGDGNRVAAFDDVNKSPIEIRDGHSLDPIPIPDVAADRGQALQKLTDATVDWDSFYEK